MNPQYFGHLHIQVNVIYIFLILSVLLVRVSDGCLTPTQQFSANYGEKKSLFNGIKMTSALNYRSTCQFYSIRFGAIAGFELAINRTRGEHANHYTIDVVLAS